MGILAPNAVSIKGTLKLVGNQKKLRTWVDLDIFIKQDHSRGSFYSYISPKLNRRGEGDKKYGIFFNKCFRTIFLILILIQETIG